MTAAETRSRLEAAGWLLTDRGRAMDIAELEYEAAGMDLKARFDGEKNALYLTLADADARKLTLKVPGDGNLVDVIALVVGRQDRLDRANYAALVGDIVKASPDTQGLRDGELVELEPS